MAVSYNTSIVKSGLVLCLDAANKKSYSQNEFINTTDLFAWSGTSANAATLSRDTISSPVGNTPLKMVVTGNDPYWNAYNSAGTNIAPAANGQTWVVSVYVKASVATTGQIFIFNGNSAGSAFSNNDYGATGISIGTEWTRVSYSWTMNSVNTAGIHVRLDGPDAGGTGQTVWWDGLQVERVTSGTAPSPYTSIYSGGSVFKDLSGNNTATLTNYPTYSSSDSGSLVFDGVNDFINIPNFKTVFAFNSEYTISSWIRPTGVNSIDIVSCYNQASNDGVWLELNTVSNFVRFVSRNLGTTIFDLSTTESVGTSVWKNIVATFNGSTAKIYVNGVEAATVASSGTPFTVANNDLNIGRIDPNLGRYFPGNISSVLVYRKALSASEVLQNFNSLRGRYGL